MLCPSSLRRSDSNPRPSEDESPPITTRPGLPLVSLEATAQHGQIRIDKRFVGKI